MRMVYTDSVIAFTESKVLGHHVENQDILSFDIIPLFQVDAIMVLNGDLAEVDSKEVKESSDDVALDNPVPVDSLKGNSSNKLEKSNSRIGKPKRQDSGVDPAGNKSVLSTSKVRNAIKISTAIDGYNSGRAYIIQTHECLRLASELSRCAQVARERHNLRSKWRKVQDKMRGIYSSNAVQGFVGLLIIVVRPSSAITAHQHFRHIRSALPPFGASPFPRRADSRASRQNFALGIAQSQLNPSMQDDSGNPTQLAGLFDLSDHIFIALFTVELAVNMACNLWRRFVRDAWCWFDLFIVGMSLLSLGPIPIPSGIIRLLRAFRVIRYPRSPP